MTRRRRARPDRIVGLTSAPTLTPSGTVREVLVTPCCGARLYRDTAPSLCMCCGRALDAVPQPVVDRVIALDPTAPITRYWA